MDQTHREGRNFVLKKMNLFPAACANALIEV
jgi:hypothetical protein